MAEAGVAHIEAGGLKIDKALHDFIVGEALPDTGIEAQAFWSGFAAIIRDLAPRNRGLLDLRDRLQEQVDGWHAARKGRPIDEPEYEAFLREIGYLQPTRHQPRSRRRTSIPRSGRLQARNLSSRFRTRAIP